ncbi:MAG: hypothetical protein K5799_15275, partial [Erythrobacter sp.]|nr:hypothetical protein [Erythrobacter sp.]
EGRSRTLRAVAGRVVEEFDTFKELVASPGLSAAERDAFGTCAEIEQEVRRVGYADFDWYEPWLVPAVSGDSGSATTEWYVAEGVHSTLVRAVELTKNPDQWQPVDAVVCRERVV